MLMMTTYLMPQGQAPEVVELSVGRGESVGVGEEVGDIGGVWVGVEVATVVGV